MLVEKAIIPAAGVGTRFLPATKIIPKEMLPLIDKPAIQHVVEEGIKSGIKSFVVVSGRNKKSIEDHFDCNPELDSFLKKKNKLKLVGGLSKIISKTSFISVRQGEPLGLGHAILSAKCAVGREHVAIMLPDDIIVGAPPGLSQIIKIATQERCSVIAVQEVPMECVSRYGVIEVKRQFSPNLFQVRDLVEKPDISKAPSNLAIVGRYVLAPEIFGALEKVSAGAIGEVQLTDGIQKMLFSGEKVFAYKMQGERYDTGTPLGMLKANISLALKHPIYSEEMINYLSKLDRELLVLQGKADSLKRQKLI